MRVISGENKGKRLFAPKDMSVRPTADKIKESIFNIIGYIPEDSIVLDLFAGTGSIGIEFLCRGAEKCYFVDVAHKSISFVKKNVALCKLEDKSLIYTMDYEKALEFFKKNNQKFDYIFADAPYHLCCGDKVIDFVLDNELLNKNGYLIIECEKSEKMFEKVDRSMVEYREKEYGITKIGIIQYLEE